MARTAADKMWVPQVAKAAGLSQASVSRYHSLAEVARRNQAAGRDGPLPGERDLPAPDDYDYPPGRVSGSPSPWWWPETIAPWLAAREGITAGRPRGDGTPARRKQAKHKRPGPRPKQQTKPARPKRRAA